MGVSFNKTGIISATGSAINDNLFLYQPKTYNPASYLGYQLNLSENLVSGETYTIQFWDIDVSHSGKTADNLGIDAYWGGGSLRMKYWHGTDYFTDGHADYLVGTFTVTSSQASHSTAVNKFFNIYNSVGNVDGTRYLHVGAWKLEHGDAPTPWCMNPTDFPTENTHGFIEYGDLTRIYSGRIEALEFIEY